MTHNDTEKDFSTLMAEQNNITPLTYPRRQRPARTIRRDKASLAYARLAATRTIDTTAKIEPGLVMVDSEQSLRFQRPSITPHALQKLRAGHFKPSLEIDLHGRTVKQAHSDILLAMGEARKEGDRCILIIHGKGSSYRDRDGMRRHTEQPVLKSHVNYWLQQISQVQAFCSAQPQDGGNGAVYVLLQQPKRRA